MMMGWILIAVTLLFFYVGVETQASGKNEIIHEKVRKTKPTPSTTKKESIIAENDEKPALVLNCPSKDAAKPLFSLPCSNNENCGFLGSQMLCCDNFCVKGIQAAKEETYHEPLLFGIIQRKCPVNPLPELSDIQKCIADEECFPPRICCGETLQNGDKVKYCRTPIPVWETLPLPSPVVEPLKTFTSYMQCTPPPPPYLDSYPKPCDNPLDCFPNLCCQEKGKKYCRPPKRSLLALVAGLGEKIIPEDAAKKFIERIS